MSDMRRVMAKHQKKNNERLRANEDAEKQWEKFDQDFEKQKVEKQRSMMDWRIAQQAAIMDKGRRLNSFK